MGYDFGEPEFDTDNGFAYGRYIASKSDKDYHIWIYFTRYNGGFNTPRMLYSSKKSYSGGNGVYGIENENVFLFIYAEKKYESRFSPFKEVPEEIKIAAEVIEKDGYDPCREIQTN